MVFNQKRSSLTSAFDGLNIESAEQQKPKRTSFFSSLSNTFRARNWPNWAASISKGKQQVPSLLHFTLRMNGNYRAVGDISDPDTKFLATSAIFNETRKLRMADPNTGDVNLLDDLTRLVFGSNFTERAGLNLDETIKICTSLWTTGVVPEEYDEKSPRYVAKLQEYADRKKDADTNQIIRSRREVIQHALALQHMVMAVVVEDHLISEELIKETHGILCNGVDVDGSPNAKYAGRYRAVNVYAGYPPTEFTKPKDISGAMRGIVRDLHLEIAMIEKTGEVDPFFLASKYCEKFVLIHPFLDGNGRMCRLILNSILLKYAGVVAVIGEHDQSRDEYLEIAARAGRENMDAAELATFVLQKSDRSMRKLRGSLERASSESNEE